MGTYKGKYYHYGGLKTGDKMSVNLGNWSRQQIQQSIIHIKQNDIVELCIFACELCLPLFEKKCKGEVNHPRIAIDLVKIWLNRQSEANRQACFTSYVTNYQYASKIATYANDQAYDAVCAVFSLCYCVAVDSGAAVSVLLSAADSLDEPVKQQMIINKINSLKRIG